MIIPRILAFALATIIAAAASAGSYTFTNIVDNSGEFDSLGAPAINNSSTVVFTATLDGSGRGIFTSRSGLTTTIADDSGLFWTFGRLSINDSGTVAFVGRFRARRGGIFASSGGAITTITDSFFADGPAINNDGTVAFTDRLEVGRRGIVTGNGGPTTIIANTSGQFSAFGDFPGISDDGTVVFLASLDNGGEAVVTSNVGVPGSATVVADTSEEFSRFPLSFTPSINAHGTVAFRADLDAGGSGIYTAEGGSITTVADTSGLFDGFGSPSINANGAVAFRGFLPDHVLGIFTGADPVADKVIQTGDMLFGSTLSDFGFLGGLNDNGDIAFNYRLANGTRGIAVARIVPEPASAGLAMIAALGGVGIVRRRRRFDESIE